MARTQQITSPQLEIEFDPHVYGEISSKDPGTFVRELWSAFQDEPRKPSRKLYASPPYSPALTSSEMSVLV